MIANAKKTIAVILSMSFFAGTALAGAMGEHSAWPWVSTLSLGAAWENTGTTQTFYLTPEIEKAYIADNSTRSLFDGELFLGLQKALPHTLQGQLGLAIGFTNNASLAGVIWDDADPEFNNHTYNYKIQHTHVAVKGKLLADPGYWLIPWISGSLGVGFNNARDFYNKPLIYEALSNPNFSSHCQTAFTYTLGAGVQKALSAHWQMGIGYEFADWGKSNLGQAAGQSLNSGLRLSHLYTNGVLLNFTYLS